MRDSSISREKKADLLESWFNAVKSSGMEFPFVKKDEIVRKVIKSPAKKFYVSEFEAQRIIGKIMRGRKPELSPVKNRMYMEIYDRTERIRRENPGIPLNGAIYKAINRQAPEFYISEKYAYNVICKQINRNKK
ncbi:MAG: hypothetical protein LBL04_02390 [Bacteroidales bacterium]|jgi:hypothetical protein|nr:hypothetical protein [Bacteroidales bacterium]